MRATDYRATFVCVALLLSSGAAADELPLGAGCQRDFAAVDDQADEHMRQINRVIASLESEMEDPAMSPSAGDSKDLILSKIKDAKLRRSEVFAKQHDDLNAIRERCGRLRGEKKR